jgi:hypothetical protein
MVWQRTIVSVVFLCAKGARALCAHKLAEAGKFAHHDEGDTVARVRAGRKTERTIELTHSRKFTLLTALSGTRRSFSFPSWLKGGR